MKKQVNAVSSTCFHILRMLRKIFRWLPVKTRRTITQALVTSRLDYGNTLYVGITARLLKRLQTIQNSAAKLILDLPKWTHITPHLKKLHWLPIQKRCQFKLLTHAYKALHNEGPAYINKCMAFQQPTKHTSTICLPLPRRHPLDPPKQH